jgi:hypothetical protein
MLAIPADYDPMTAAKIIRVNPTNPAVGEFASLANAIRSEPEKLTRSTTIVLPGDMVETIHDGAGTGGYVYLRRGVAHDAPFSIVWDGSGTQKPRIRPTHATSLRFDQTPGGIPGNVLMRGICFDDPKMNPAAPAAAAPLWQLSVQGGWLSSRTVGMMPVRLEYCEWLNNNLSTASGGVTDPANTMHWLDLYRCTFRNGWSYTNAHGQGVQATGVLLRMKECIVAHGGWTLDANGGPLYRADGQLNGTLFNHGCYFIDLIEGSEIVDNIYVENCSVGIKVRSTANNRIRNLTIARNLVTGNEVGIGYAGQQNTGPIWPDRAFVDCVTEDNVVLLTPQRTGTPKTATGRMLAWGIGGGSMDRCIWRNNIVANGLAGRDNRTLTFEALRADGVPDVYNSQFLDNTGVDVNATNASNDYFRVNKLESNNVIRHRPAVGKITTYAALGNRTPEQHFNAIVQLDQRSSPSQWAELSAATVNARVRAAVWGDAVPPVPPPDVIMEPEIVKEAFRINLPTPTVKQTLRFEDGSTPVVNGQVVNLTPGVDVIVETELTTAPATLEPMPPTP